MTKIKINTHWGLSQGSVIETTYNDEIQKCFREKDLGRITLATVIFPEAGRFNSDIEYDLEFTKDGELNLVKVTGDTSEKRRLDDE